MTDPDFDPDAKPAVDMFKNPNYEHEEDPAVHAEQQALAEAIQKEKDQQELLGLLREWKASNG